MVLNLFINQVIFMNDRARQLFMGSTFCKFLDKLKPRLPKDQQYQTAILGG